MTNRQKDLIETETLLLQVPSVITEALNPTTQSEINAAARAIIKARLS